jgi:23S rRNA (guanosine2251-2'-O)-methyltransferase
VKPRVTYGVQAVRMALAGGRAERVYLQAGLGAKRLGRLAEDLARAAVPVSECTAAELRSLTGSEKHQGVAADVRGPGTLTEREVLDLLVTLSAPLLLVLDGVQDPRNFGSILRTADAAGVDLVVTARNRNVAITPVVSKVASGAAEVQPVAEVANLARFLAHVADAGIRIVGTDGTAEKSLFDAELTGAIALVLGAEGEGLRRLTREHCDELVRLPMHGVVESLNVGVAAGICLYEALRQRGRLAPGQALR